MDLNSKQLRVHMLYVHCTVLSTVHSVQHWEYCKMYMYLHCSTVLYEYMCSSNTLGTNVFHLVKRENCIGPCFIIYALDISILDNATIGHYFRYFAINILNSTVYAYMVYSILDTIE